MERQRHLRSRFLPSAHARPSFWRRLSVVDRDRIQTELGAALAPYRNRDAAWSLALLVLERQGTTIVPFPLDRRALTGLDSLGLSEARCRGAIGTLEATGLVEREPEPPGSAYQRKGDALHRKPILYRIGAAFRGLVAAIAKALSWLKAKMARLSSPKDPTFGRKEIDSGQLRAPSPRRVVFPAGTSLSITASAPPIEPDSALGRALARLLEGCRRAGEAVTGS